jgi:hypothetical protein
MRHQVRNDRRFAGEIVRLPDGRRLVADFNQPMKLLDTEGNETAASAAELAALMVFRGMSFPRKLAASRRRSPR